MFLKVYNKYNKYITILQKKIAILIYNKKWQKYICNKYSYSILNINIK